MDPHGTGGSGSNVPAFLAKLWTLVEDPETDPLICWSPEGNSFHVFDQGRFAKDVLPKYFKHNNMASFVRQLNMYGFRKVVHIEQGGLVKPEKDDTEFQHPYFIRGQESLLENIKRKVNNVTCTKNEEVKGRQDNVGKLLTDIHILKGKQENMDCRILAMKHENEALWREVASLRQKHSQQQKVVNKVSRNYTRRSLADSRMCEGQLSLHLLTEGQICQQVHKPQNIKNVFCGVSLCSRPVWGGIRP
ncbi:heat shock factor protein-like [Bombina bombina]|uniref:heat shock factor protein-like n=1 Tax=Bombina bombina TaxID=8345 RepID=UPI00235B0893|nr:heat shock factor protein-like [Bombina bombina]XP_053571474.1 heat shock factor protein-like [Bombina bombina]